MDGSNHFLNSREDVNLADRLAMIAYGIVILPIIHDICTEHTNVIQPWYADNTGAGGRV